MSKNRKRTMLIATAAALVALLIVGGTLALLTDQDRVRNILGIGGDNSNPGSGGENLAIKVRIDEPKYDKIATDKTLDSIVANEKILKDPKVVSVGTDEIYVRVYFKDDRGELTLKQVKEMYGVTFDETVGWKEHTDNKLYLMVPMYRDATGTQLKEANIFTIKTDANTGTGLDQDRYTEDGEYTMVIPNVNNDTMKNYHNLTIVVDAVQARGLPGGVQVGWGNVDASEIKPAM